MNTEKTPKLHLAILGVGLIGGAFGMALKDKLQDDIFITGNTRTEKSLHEAKALKAIDDGADYIGIQTCYATRTKVTAKKPIGHIGVREILEAIPVDHPLRTVAIGGINQTNIPRLISLSRGYNGREFGERSRCMTQNHCNLPLRRCSPRSLLPATHVLDSGKRYSSPAPACRPGGYR